MERSGEASTLAITAFNVGMLQPDCYRTSQDAKVNQLAVHVKSWLNTDVPAIVGINEIDPGIATKLVEKLRHKQNVDVSIATNESNILLWRTPQ